MDTWSEGREEASWEGRARGRWHRLSVPEAPPPQSAGPTWGLPQQGPGVKGRRGLDRAAPSEGLVLGDRSSVPPPHLGRVKARTTGARRKDAPCQHTSQPGLERPAGAVGPPCAPVKPGTGQAVTVLPGVPLGWNKPAGSRKMAGVLEGRRTRLPHQGSHREQGRGCTPPPPRAARSSKLPCPSAGSSATPRTLPGGPGTASAQTFLYSRSCFNKEHKPFSVSHFGL